MSSRSYVWKLTLRKEAATPSVSDVIPAYLKGKTKKKKKKKMMVKKKKKKKKKKRYKCDYVKSRAQWRHKNNIKQK